MTQLAPTTGRLSFRRPDTRGRAVLLTELGEELDLSVTALKDRCAALEIPVWHIKRQNVVSPEGATRLRAHYAQHLSKSEAAQWMTASQAAAALGLTLPQFYDRVKDGRLAVMHRAARAGRGRTYRYNPSDVSREAKRLGVQPRGKLRGHLTSNELAELLDVTREALNQWGRAGCPRVKNSRGWCQWDPAKVLAWLEANPLRIDRDSGGPHAFVAHRKAMLRRLRERVEVAARAERGESAATVLETAS